MNLKLKSPSAKKKGEGQNAKRFKKKLFVYSWQFLNKWNIL